jgi:hypothetical protein
MEVYQVPAKENLAAIKKILTQLLKQKILKTYEFEGMNHLKNVKQAPSVNTNKLNKLFHPKHLR